MSTKKPVPGKDGNKYVPFEARTGESSVVFFTRDLSEEGLKKIVYYQDMGVGSNFEDYEEVKEMDIWYNEDDMIVLKEKDFAI